MSTPQNEPLVEALTVRLPGGLLARLDAIVMLDSSTSKGDLIRRALEEYLDRLPPAVKQGVEDVLETKRRTLRATGGGRA